MNNILNIKGKTLGAGIPLVCVPIMAAKQEEIAAEAARLVEAGVEMLEWRVDAFENYHSLNDVRDTLEILRPIVKDTILLFTYRSQGQGGLGENNGPLICDINEAAAETKVADIIDFEYFAAEKNTRLLRKLQKMGAYVVASHHDFEETPDPEVIRFLLEEEFESGADIVKLALMPQNVEDVLNLLAETARFHQEHPDTPVITMSMGALGKISRVSGGTFGSCVTFGAGTKASAPGQIAQDELRKMLTLL